MQPVVTTKAGSSPGARWLFVSALALFTAAVYLAFPARLFFGEGFKWALRLQVSHEE